MTPSSWRLGRRRWSAVGALALLTVPLAAAGCGSDDENESDPSRQDSATSTTVATGGIEVAAPDGWTEIPLPVLGFGVAVPPGWEATRLDEEGLASSEQAAPVVPGFVAAAHNAAQSGAVFYAAGVDGDGRVTELKVRAAVESGVTDAGGLEDYARQLAADAGIRSPTIDVVAEAPQPTVEVRFRGQGERAADDDPSATVDVTVEGTERLVLSPSGVVYSLIVTSEDAGAHDDLAGQIFSTLAFPPEDS